MTAIVWQYIPEGFIIGADGRRRESGSGLIETESAQKIYSVKIGDVRLAYAWSGTTIFHRTDEVICDLKHVTDCILQSINPARVTAFSDFLHLFNDGLHVLLLAYIGGAVRTFEKPEIARLLLIGYFKDEPHAAHIIVRHDGNTVLKPEIKCSFAPVRFDVFSGSKRVYEELIHKIVREPSSLREASELVQDYISACMKYQDVDADCANIGGRIHIGQLTPERFSWLRPPVPD
ncbi:MAG: hypothetical protein WB780_08435 [Candidatus Acidiferrales bacterium]